jgi:hypothetical protein
MKNGSKMLRVIKFSGTHPLLYPTGRSYTEKIGTDTTKRILGRHPFNTKINKASYIYAYSSSIGGEIFIWNNDRGSGNVTVMIKTCSFLRSWGNKKYKIKYVARKK